MEPSIEIEKKIAEPAPKRPRIEADKTVELPSTSSQPLLKCVEFATLVTTPHHTVSTFVPNASMFMHTISTIDNEIVVSDHRFAQNNPLWHPLLTRIYGSILFYIQIIRCMVYSKIATYHLRTLLIDFEKDFPFDAIPVPTYFEPFLKSLCTTKVYDDFGIVSPFIPNIAFDEMDENVLPQPFRSYLPDIVCLFRGYINITRQGNAQADRSFDRNLFDPHANNPSPVGPENPHISCRDARISPGLKEPCVLTSRSPMQYASQPNLLSLPWIANDELVDNWATFLCLNLDNKWFSDLLKMFSSYCRMFPGSKTLKDISVYDGQFALIEIYLDHIYEDEIEARLIESRRYFASATGSCRLIDIKTETVQISCLSQVTALHPPNYVADIPIDDQANMIFNGPYWTITPLRSMINQYDPSMLLPYIADQLHVSFIKPLKK